MVAQHPIFSIQFNVLEMCLHKNDHQSLCKLGIINLEFLALFLALFHLVTLTIIPALQMHLYLFV